MTTPDSAARLLGAEPAPDTRPVKFWDCDEHAEELYHTEIEEAVEDWADAIHPEPLPETVRVYGYAVIPLPSPDWFVDAALEQMLERLDEEHGDPDEISKPTDAMRAAALAFVQTVLAEYRPWGCKVVTSVVANVRECVPAEWFAQ